MTDRERALLDLLAEMRGGGYRLEPALGVQRITDQDATRFDNAAPKFDTHKREAEHWKAIAEQHRAVIEDLRAEVKRLETQVETLKVVTASREYDIAKAAREVAADEFREQLHSIAQEREACARLVETGQWGKPPDGMSICDFIAAAIRARTQKAWP